MNLASSIPAETVTVWERAIANYDKKHKDNQSARNLLEMRNVGAAVDQDTVQFIEGAGGNAKIAAKIVAKGAVPDTTGTKAQEIDHKIYQLAVGFYLHERDLQAKPELRTRNIEWCTKQIRRLEDYLLFNGDATINLTSLPTFAATNPNGKIVAAGASGNDANNVGTWAGSDADIDIQKDVVVEGLARLGTDYEPSYLVGRRSVLKYIVQLDDMRQSYADEICGHFGKQPNDFTWLWMTDYAPAGNAFIVGKDMDAGEFVVSEELAIDANNPKEKGGNYYTELKEWVTLEYHDPEAYVSIVTT
jgi:hypothetical protein